MGVIRRWLAAAAVGLAALSAPVAGAWAQSTVMSNPQISGASPVSYAQQIAVLRARTDIANTTLPTPAAATATATSGGKTTLARAAATSLAATTTSGPTTCTTAAPSAAPEIVELARALKNDPDLIYEYVYNNIETLPQYGSLKGPLGALVDGKGTAFDQAELMVLLLQQAQASNCNITAPQIVTGSIWLTQAQLSNWMGVDPNDNCATVSTCATSWALGSGGFPGGVVNNSNNVPVCDLLGWAWVSVQILGSDGNFHTISFDPAGKLSNQPLTDLQNQYALSCAATTPTQATATGYTLKAGVTNLATAMGYSQSTFLSTGAGGAENGVVWTDITAGNHVGVSGLNRTNTRGNLTTYSNNLVSWIRANKPAASTADIIGSRAITPLPLHTQQRWASLPYACDPATQSSSCATVTSYAALPSMFRTTLELDVPGVTMTGGAAPVFNSSDLYGHRLTIFFDSATNQPVLALDGLAQGTVGTAAAAGTTVSFTAKVVHPYQTAFANATSTLKVVSGGYFVVESGWGPVGRGMIEKHRRQLLLNQHANPTAPTSEPVMGETLAVLGYNWLGELAQTVQVTGRITGVQSVSQHAVGIVGYKNLDASGHGAPYVDLPMVQFAIEQLSSRSNTTSVTPLESAAFFTDIGMASVLESGILEQTMPGNTAVSTVKLLDEASKTDTIYDIDNAAVSGDGASYWTGTLRSRLAAYYGSTNVDLSRIDGLVSSGLRVVASLHGPQAVSSYWSGDGYFQLSQDGSTIGAIITGGLSGGNIVFPTTGDAVGAGAGANVADPASSSASTSSGAVTGAPSLNSGASTDPNSAVGVDPVNMVTGAFENDHTDLAVGSGSTPYGLSFGRRYDSSSRLAIGPMGAGWSHSVRYSAAVDSDGFAGLGADSPISGAAAIATIYVLQDIYNLQTSTNKPLDRVVVGVQAERWLMDQMTSNVVNVVQPSQVAAFIKLADGSYNAPLGSNATLTLSGGLYTLKTASLDTLSFNTAGNIATLHYAAGPSLTFTYNGSNQLTSVTNGMGRTLTLSYTGSLVTGVTDGTRSVSYAYDGTSNLTTFTDAAGNQTKYVYDQPGRISQIFYPSFPTTAFITNTYDGLDRVKVQADANGNVTNLYIAGSRTETDDPAGTADVLYFTARGDTLAHVDGLGHQTLNAYDGLGRLTKTTAPELNTVTYVYDDAHGAAAQQNVLSITAAAKPGSSLAAIVQSMTYDTTCLDKVKTATDPNGNVATNVYDAATCNLTEVDQPAVGGITPKATYTYNSRGQVLTKTDPVGKVTLNAYDTSTEELLSVTDDNAHLLIKVQYGYDTVGNVTSVTDPNGNVTTSTYDLLRRVTQVTAPTTTGAVTKTTYNPDGMVTQVQKATGNTTTPWQTSTATYSPSGKTLTATDANGNTTTNTYDALDRVATVKDAVNRITTYGYDVLSRQVSVSNTALQATPLLQYSYTANGKRQTLTDANGNVTTYVYDGFDRLSQTQFPSTTRGAGTSDSTNYAAVSLYDANSNPLTVQKRDGTVIHITYDVLNRPTEKQYPGDVNDVFYTYDLDGRVTSTRYGSVTGTGVIYTYDTAGRVLTEATNGRTLTYAYDANSNRTRETWPDAFYVTYAYDALNRITSVNENGATSGVGVLASYAYNPLSQRTGVTRGNGGSSTYGYDAGGRLTSLAHAMPTAGAASNVSLTLTYTAANQLQSRASSNSVYDWTNFTAGTTNKTADGLNRDASIVALSDGYDHNGSVTDDGTRRLTYDYENRITGATMIATSAVTALAYDPLGRLQQQQTTPSGGSTATTQFLYDGARLSAEYDGSGNMLRRYVHGPGTDEPIVWYEGSGVTDRRWLHADERGSIIAYANVSGAVTTYAYGPYGEPAAWSGSRFSYTGQIMIPEIALYHYKARAYDPAAGRFMQTDPIGYDGGQNLYAYVGDDPMNLTDPSGHCSSYANADCQALHETQSSLVTVSSLPPVSTLGEQKLAAYFDGNLQLPTVFQVGLATQGTIGFGAGQGGTGWAFDLHGNYAQYTVVGVGLGMGAGGAEGVALAASNAKTIQDLAGPFANASAGGGAVVGGTVDVFGGGGVVGAGITVGLAGGETSFAGGTDTVIGPQRNIFDFLKPSDAKSTK